MKGCSFSDLWRRFGLAGALNAWYELYRSLPSEFSESDAAREASGLRGLDTPVETLLRQCYG